MCAHPPEGTFASLVIGTASDTDAYQSSLHTNAEVRSLLLH